MHIAAFTLGAGFGLRPHLDGCPARREEYHGLRALVGGDRLL